MLKRFRVEESKDTNIVRVPVDVIRRATEAIFRICGLTVCTFEYVSFSFVFLKIRHWWFDGGTLIL